MAIDNPVVAPTLPRFGGFNISNPVAGALANVDSNQAHVFDILKLSKGGKLADYRLFYLGSTVQPAAVPSEVYKHVNERVEMGVKLSNMSGKKIGYWVSGQTRTGDSRSMAHSHRAFLTGVLKRREIFYTLRALSTRAARKEMKTGALGKVKVSSGVETFVADAGRCPHKTKCGKRVMMAQGHRTAHWMKFYSPCTTCPPGSTHCNPLVAVNCNHNPIGTMVKTGQKTNKKVGGKTQTYRLTTAPGVDPWIMLNMATFFDTTNNIEEARQRIADLFR